MCFPTTDYHFHSTNLPREPQHYPSSPASRRAAHTTRTPSLFAPVGHATDRRALIDRKASHTPSPLFYLPQNTTSTSSKTWVNLQSESPPLSLCTHPPPPPLSPAPFPAGHKTQAERRASNSFRQIRAPVLPQTRSDPIPPNHATHCTWTHSGARFADPPPLLRPAPRAPPRAPTCAVTEFPPYLYPHLLTVQDYEANRVVLTLAPHASPPTSQGTPGSWSLGPSPPSSPPSASARTTWRTRESCFAHFWNNFAQ